MSSTEHGDDRHLEKASSSFTDEGLGGKTQEGKSQGVLTAEAVKALSGWKLWVLYLGIGVTAYLYGLDNNTMYAYLTIASESTILYGTVSVIQQVLIAVGKFPIAKLSDVFGRAQGYAISLLCYIIGFVIIASSQSFSNTCGGVVFYALGNSGTQIMQQIVVADAVNTRWRGLALGLLSLPYIINFAVASKISAHFIGVNWRWGPGVFAILMPVAISPIIFTLALSQRKAKKDNIASEHPYKLMGAKKGSIAFFHDIDMGGLFLLCAGWLLILLPLTLWSTAPNGWRTGYIIAMLVLGGVFLIALGFYEWLVAPEPIIRKRFMLNKNVLGPCIAAFFDFYSFYLSWSSAYYFVIILKGWNLVDAGYFSNAQSLALTVFGIAAGGLNLLFKRYKWTFFAGGVIRMLGIGLMIAYRNAESTTAQLVIPQILQGLGGGILGIELTVAAQVSVPHQDVALVTSLLLLLAEIGGACGTATLTAVQAHIIPQRLAELLPGNTAAQTAIVASPYLATSTYALGTPERTAMITAWSDYMHTVLVIGIVMSAIPIIIIPFLSDYKLNRSQNVVEYNENDERVQLREDKL